MVSSPELTESLAAWRMWQQSQNLSERTISERATVIRNLYKAAGTEFPHITPQHIMAFTSRPAIGNSTRATYHAHIRAWCKWLVQNGYRDDNPATQTPTPKPPKCRPRPVSNTALPALMLAANRRRTLMMILLAALAGLRVHEIAKIRGEDIDRDARILYVRGKGAKDATIPLHQGILDYAHMFPKKGYWFPSYTNPNQPILRNSVSKAISETMERAGIDGTPHQLRHWYATTLLDDGASLRTVQELLRHESLMSTAIYTQVSTAQKTDAITRLHLPAA